VPTIGLYAKHDGSGNTGVGFGGGINFWGDRNGDNARQTMGRIFCVADINSGTNISGALTFETSTAGTPTEKLRITNTGRVLIGSTAAVNVGGSSANSQLQIEGTSGNTSSLTLIRNQNSTGGSIIRFGKTRGSSTGAVTTVADGDTLGNITFSGADGTDIQNATAQIKVVVNGTVGGNQIPTDITFETSASSGANRSERLRIGSNSNITQTIDTDGDGFIITTGSANIKPMLTGNSNRSAENNTIFGISGKWNNTEIGRIAFEAGDDTTNKDNGKIRLYTTPSGGSLTARMTILDNGNLGLGTQTPEEELTIASINPCLRLNDSDNYHRVVSSGENLVLECDTGNQRTGSFIAFRVDGAVDRCRVTEHGLTPNPNDTAEANALQDYEEGTFVPTLADSSGNTSTFGSVTSARYTKIGNTVRASFRAVNVQTTVLQGSATFYLKGLPFTTNGRNYATAWLRSFNASNWGAQKCLVFAYVESNQVYFQGDDGNAGGATVKVEDFTHNQSDIFMTMVYETTQ